MSQQKMFFALVLVAGCVAMASGQNFDMNQCTQAGQKLVSEYTQNMQESFSKFTSALSQQGASTFDVQKMNDQMQQMMSELQKLVNTNGFNFEQVMNTWMKVVTMQRDIFTQMFNPSTAISMGREYMNLLNSMMTNNSNFALSMTTACVPQLRDSRIPAY